MDSHSIRILVVDDDEAHADTVAEALRRVGYQCTVAVGGREGLKRIEDGEYDIILTDLVMDPVGGIEILKRARQELPDAEVVILTGHATVRTAVAAMQAGASGYLQKPLDLAELRTVVEKTSKAQRLARANQELRRQLDERFGFEGVVGNSASMRSVVDRLKQIAPTNATVLITGESGTGKELVAKAIHNNSPRRNKPFVPLNCAALSENVLESELFGHIKGAFTGADRERKGFIEHAHGGTLFLDEVGDIPLSTQVKLLRVLESGEVVRMGTNEPIKVNVRLVSATNRNLQEAINAGTFRADLYHRIKVVNIKLAPLRSRREDIPLLLDHFVRQFAEAYGRPVPSISPPARRALTAYPWPGNVRELRNAIESMVVIDTDGVLDLDDLAEEMASTAPAAESPGQPGLIGQPLKEIEKYFILETLKLTEGNREEAAKILGISERTIYRALDRYQKGEV
ncbi:MAG: sigma-54 dependent transcriptional regulator [Isosphaeraceae bacterium]